MILLQCTVIEDEYDIYFLYIYINTRVYIYLF